MSNRVFNIGNPLYFENTVPKQTYEQASAEEESFKKILERFDAAQETDEEREKRLKAENSKAIQQKEQQQKIMALQSLISELRSQLSIAGGKNPAIESRLSAAQTELYWLLFSF